MAYQAMQLADEIVDTAKANDIAVDSVLKLRSALALSGGEAENAGKFLSSFTATIDKAAEGSFETQKTFKTLGVSLDDLRKMNIDQLFSKTVESLSNMDDPLTRNAKAMELFGRAAKGVDFVALNEELKTGAGVTEAQAKAIEDAAAAYDDLAKAGREFSVMLASELGPSIKATVDYIGGMKNEFDITGKIFKTVFQTIVVVGSDVAFVIKGIVNEMAALFRFADDLVNKNLATATANYSEYFKKAIQGREELDKFQSRVLGAEDANANTSAPNKPASGPSRNVVAGLSPEDKKRLQEAEAARKKALKDAEDAEKKRQELIARGAGEEMRQREENNRLLAEQETMYQRGNAAIIDRQQLASVEIDRAKEMMELVFQGRNMRGEDLQFAQELKTIEWARLDAIKQINANEALTREARASAIERENAMAEKSVELARTRLELTRQTRLGSLTEGFSNALETMGRNAATDFERGQQAFQSVLGNMESAIDRFVKTGKLSFKDLARSIITDMIAIQMKAAALRFLGGIFSGMSGGGGTSMSQLDYAVVSGYADGGDPPVGRPSIVGERGPEIFVPRTAGTIIPNHALSGMGSTTNVTNNYINAIDTKSFEDRLLGSSNAIWAANQYANKSLAVNRGRA
jgi:lambda family phage tail tape measure protein